MVVALGAADRERQEGLARVLRQRFRILVHGEVVRRAVLEARPAGGEQVGHDPVPRGVLRHAVADPLVVGVHRGRPQLGAGYEQHVGPLVGPIVHELRAGEQQFDEPFTLAGRSILPKSVHLLGARQPADRVEEGTAEERGVVARRRRLETKLLQLHEHQVVDQVGPRSLGEDVGRHVVREGGDDPRHRDLG